MNDVPAGPPLQRWTWTRWLIAVAVVLAAHAVLILAFGTRKSAPAMPVKNPTSLTLAGEFPGDWIALNNATLFALPDRKGFTGLMWLELPHALPFHEVDWTEKPRFLLQADPLPAAGLGAPFNRYVQTNQTAAVHLEFNTPPEVGTPLTPSQPPFAQNSTLQIRGEIAKRPLLNQLNLPSWPFADVVAPSVVQVLVDAAGNVVSAVLLPQEVLTQGNFWETPSVRDDDADRRAVELARTARFAPRNPGEAADIATPISSLDIGELIFNWQTVPVMATNGSPKIKE